MTDVVLDEVDTNDLATPVAYEVAFDLEIDAPPDAVWRALTEEVGSWWAHSYQEDIVGIFLEPWPGGRFYEKFDEEGNGGLYAVVTYAEKPKLIRFQGPMGMPGSQVTTGRWELVPNGVGTILKINGWVMGDMPEPLIEARRQGGSEIYSSLKQYLEHGVSVR